MSYRESVVRHVLLQVNILVVTGLLAAWWFCWPSSMIAEDWLPMPPSRLDHAITKGPLHPGDCRP